jgi:HEAT repeat protein
VLASCGKEELYLFFFPTFFEIGLQEKFTSSIRKGVNGMGKVVLIAACFLIFQTVALIDALHAQDSKVQKSDLPRALLPKTEGRVTIGKGEGSISFWSTGSTLEEILERFAVEKKVILRFYCQDPGLKPERAVNLRISAGSLEKALQQLLSGEHRFTPLNREGKPIENAKDIAAINIYPTGCTGTDPPVRVFIAEREHPLLKKLPEEISLEELSDLLKRGGPASRRMAADILGLKAGEKSIAYAKEALKDENPGVMFAAANALKRLGKKYGAEKVADAIDARFREKPYAEFLPMMAEVDRNKFWPIIDGIMDQSGEREKGIIVRSLFLTNDRRAIRYLSRISSAGSMETSKQAIYAIGKIGGPEAAAALMMLLREGNVQRQASAAQAVSFLSKEDGVEVRAEVEKIVREERVPDALLQALAEISYLEPLEKLMKDPASKAELKIRALKAMTAKGGEKIIEVMSMGLNDEAPQVRAASVEAMGSRAMEAAIPYLIKATEDKDAKVRKSAIKGLSEFPWNDQIVEALGKVIDDPDESVRRGAVDAFRLLGEPSKAMIAILNNCKNHKDPYVANKAGSILRHWGLE